MICSGLSLLTNLTFVISGFLFDGQLYQDSTRSLQAVRIEDPLTHHFEVFANDKYKACFPSLSPSHSHSISHSLILPTVVPKWKPDEPLIHWSRDEVETELVECKNNGLIMKAKLNRTKKELLKIQKLQTKKKAPLSRRKALSVMSRSIAPLLVDVQTQTPQKRIDKRVETAKRIIAHTDAHKSDLVFGSSHLHPHRSPSVRLHRKHRLHHKRHHHHVHHKHHHKRPRISTLHRKWMKGKAWHRKSGR